MNTALFLRAAARHWYVVVVGLALTAVAAGALILHAPTVYWAETTVTLLQPDPNPLATESYPLTDVASALVLHVNGGPANSKTSSPETTLYGEGVLDGARTRIRDVGGQWTRSIPDPVILVEAVGPTAAEVESRVTRRVEQLRAGLLDLQTDLDVLERKRVFIQASPEQPEIISVTGRPNRAAGGVIVVGCSITGLTVAFVGRRWNGAGRVSAAASGSLPTAQEEQRT